MDVLSRAAHALKRTVRSRYRLGMVGGLALILSILSLVKPGASSQQPPTETGSPVQITGRIPQQYDCGFERRGAEEAIARHRMNALRSPKQLAARGPHRISPNSYDQN